MAPLQMSLGENGVHSVVLAKVTDGSVYPSKDWNGVRFLTFAGAIREHGERTKGVVQRLRL